MMQNTRASKTGVSLFQPTKTTTHLNKKPILHCRSNANRLSFVTTSAATVDAPSTTNETTPQGKFTPAEWDSFTGAYTSQYIEHAQFLEEGSIEGTIPAELQGTLLRNGPALYEIGGAEIPQPFDGDGMAVTFCFPGGGRPPFVANRFIRTADFLAEQEAGKMIFKGAFSVGNPSGAGFYNPFDFSIKKVANTGIVNWAGRIMALYERDLQYQLTAPDLRTTGRTDAGGAIDGDFIAAHYRIVQQEDGSRRFVGFSSAESGLDNAVTVWEFDEAGNQLHRTTATLPDAAFAFLHDFAVTEKYYVFAENPVRLDFGKLLTKYMFGKACIAECLKYDVAAKKTKLHVIPRPGAFPADTPAALLSPRVYTSPTPFFSFHHVNAYESADGKIVLDTVALLEGMDFSANLKSGAAYYDDNVGRGTLTRVVMTPWSGEVCVTGMMQRACEFPCVAPRVAAKPHRFAYLSGARMDSAQEWGAPQVVVKVTYDDGGNDDKNNSRSVQQKVYSPGEERWAGEPIFVPRENNNIDSSSSSSLAEDDGWVLVVVFDSKEKRSELVVLGAQEMEVVATVKLPFFLPAGLHGSFSSEYLGPPADVEYAARKYDIRNGAAKYE